MKSNILTFVQLISFAIAWFTAFLMICSFLGTKCGENLYMSSDPTAWSNAIQNWYDESHNFVYGVGPKSSSAVVGHYTQVKRTNKNISATNALI